MNNNKTDELFNACDFDAIWFTQNLNLFDIWIGKCAIRRSSDEHIIYLMNVSESFAFLGSLKQSCGKNS